MHPFSAPWKHQKTVSFSDVFMGVEKGCIENKCVDKDPHDKNQLHTSAHSRDITDSLSHPLEMTGKICIFLAV